MAGTDLLRRDGGGFGVNAKAFYAGTLGDMVIFGALIFAAFRARFNPAAHKRLILVATITLMEAAINRWCPPEKPQGSLILGGPSVWLQNRDCA
jgi:hypothetical protein